jgi:putative transcriptional regulator
MTNPSQHLPQGILIEYVNGRASEAVALAVACHATLCGICQGRIADWEALAGAALETAPGLSMREGLLENVLSRLDAEQPTDEPAPSRPASRAATALRLPRPLLRYLDRAGGLRWKLLLPGIHVAKFRLGSGVPADVDVRLVRIKAGLVVPLHDHAGPEYTVVFSGAFDDAGVRYGRGDACVRKAGDRHVQRILGGEDCVALAVNHGPLVPLTWTGRLMGFFGDRRIDFGRRSDGNQLSRVFAPWAP